MFAQALDILTSRRGRLILTWLVLLAAIGHRCVQGWINFEVPERPDGNDGHTSIDFGGQWMMGRLLVLGHGRELYSRSKHLEVAREGFRQERETADSHDHDAERLVGWYVGLPTDAVGGPLYPPVHAFVMAPFGLISNPYWSYRVAQAFMLGCVFIAGLGVRYMTNGRWWWSAATAFLLLFPGCRGGIDLAQNSTVTVMLLIWGWALLVRGRPGWGGLIWGLLAFKPVWALSFLFALLLLRQWRASLTMCATGAGLVLLTIPFVGIQSWFDWLHIGSQAAEAYQTDRNWIFLSRDLFGITRRMFLDFEDGRALENKPIAGYSGWALWGVVAGTTILLAIRKRRGTSLEGIYPAMILLGAFLCAYRFMYYDAMIAVLGAIVLMADPRPFFRKAWWPFASWSSILVGMLLLVENATAPLNVDVTANVGGLKRTVVAADDTTEKVAPKFYVGSGDYYPWDTVVVIWLWAWCGARLVRRRNQASTDSEQGER